MSKLTTCTDCGRQVSSAARHCPGCGRQWPDRGQQGAAYLLFFGVPVLALLILVFLLA